MVKALQSLEIPLEIICVGRLRFGNDPAAFPRESETGLRQNFHQGAAFVISADTGTVLKKFVAP